MTLYSPTTPRPLAIFPDINDNNNDIDDIEKHRVNRKTNNAASINNKTKTTFSDKEVQIEEVTENVVENEAEDGHQ